MQEIQHQFDRLKAVYHRIGRDLNRQAPATDEEIASIAATTGIEVDESLKALWKFSNGSDRTMWFAEGEDEFTPYYLLSVHDVLKSWRMSAPYEWNEDEEEWGERDSRIQKHVFCHRAWLPFGELNGGSHVLYFDAAPTPDGTPGQIINYVHDPDFMYWTSASFFEFLKASNDTLEEWLDDPDALREQLWLWD
jgi:cell wall assembly regulator SMI1